MDKDLFRTLMSGVLDCYRNLTDKKRNQMKNDLFDKYSDWKNYPIETVIKKMTDYINSKI